MRVVIITLSWTLVWALGGWMFGRFGTDKGASWAIAIPLVLPCSMAIWGTVRGAFLWERRGAIRGALVGTVAGATLGWIGFCCLAAAGSLVDGLAFRDVPAWLNEVTIYTVAGVVAGVATGALGARIDGSVMHSVRREDDLLGRTRQ
jgi:hypothetical protein